MESQEEPMSVFGFSPRLPGGQAEGVRVPFADTDTNAFRGRVQSAAGS